jgi:hypothetical protein
MDHSRIVLLAALTVIIAFVATTSFAQDTSNFPYMNPKLSAEERAADLSIGSRSKRKLHNLLIRHEPSRA